MKKVKSPRRGEVHAYLYVTTTCPECGANLRNINSVQVELTISRAASNTHPEFLSHLDPEGWLIDPDGYVAKGLHSMTTCASCDHDLYLYEAKHWGQPAPQGHRLFPWSREDLIKLGKFPPGDVSGMVQNLCRYIIDNHHDQLAHGEDVNLPVQVEEIITHVTKLMRVWVATSQARVKQWRDGDAKVS